MVELNCLMIFPKITKWLLHFFFFFWFRNLILIFSLLKIHSESESRDKWVKNQLLLILLCWLCTIFITVLEYFHRICGRCRPYHFTFLKTVVHNLYQVHSWIICRICSMLTIKAMGKVFQNKLSKFCGNQIVKNLNWYIFFYTTCINPNILLKDFKGFLP